MEGAFCGYRAARTLGPLPNNIILNFNQRLNPLLSFYINQLLQNLVAGGDYSGVRLIRALGGDHFNKFLGEIDIRHFD
jgi:hypothetical protein